MSFPAISVVIPCFNLGNFLGIAIESVLHQTRPVDEVIVVDDGSSDNTDEVAQRYPCVRYIRQSNRGLSAALNTGLRGSRGDYLIFLDADDVLQPCAAAVGAAHLDAHPEWAFVSGAHRRVGPDLEPIGSDCCWPVHSHHYRALLRANYIGMHAAVMYRRPVLSAFGGFDESLRACEDYDVYLRIARQHPVGCHAEIAALYRQHPDNMSRNPERMLSAALRVLRAQAPYVIGDPALEAAYQAGIRNWWQYFGDAMWKEFRRGLPLTLAQPVQLQRLARLSLHYPYVRTWARKSGLRPSTLSRRFHEFTHRPREVPIKPVQFGSFRSPVPLGSTSDDGSVAARYCELFFDGAPYTTDLAGLATLPDQSQAAVRCYLGRNVAETIHELHRILKPSGTLHAILPGVVMASTPQAQDDWRFTPKGASRLFSPLFRGHLEIASRGNPITALAALHRLPASTLAPQDFLADDPQYPLLITVRATRTSA